MASTLLQNTGNFSQLLRSIPSWTCCNSYILPQRVHRDHWTPLGEIHLWAGVYANQDTYCFCSRGLRNESSNRNEKKVWTLTLRMHNLKENINMSMNKYNKGQCMSSEQAIFLQMIRIKCEKEIKKGFL